MREEITKSYGQTILNGVGVATEEVFVDGRKISTMIIDRRYYDYIHWRDIYRNGQISKELLDEIFKVDNLGRFIFAGDLYIAPGNDERYQQTREFETKFYELMAAKESNPNECWRIFGELVTGVIK